MKRRASISNARNTLLAYGAERSSKMDFSEYDRIDDFELNEILWRADQRARRSDPPGRATRDRLSQFRPARQRRLKRQGSLRRAFGPQPCAKRPTKS